MSEKKQPFYKRSDFWIDAILLALVFTIMVAWSLQPGMRPAGPDEPMRYDVAEWMYQHPGQIPRGDTPEIRNPNWGVSYAFYPILSYMISAVFMMIAGIFTKDEAALLQTARFAPTIFMMIASWFTLQTGKKLFGKDMGRLYACLVIFLPGFHFLGTFVNNDALALVSAAIILHAWVGAVQDGWTKKVCLELSVGMGICFLSYYNAYGWILWSFLFFCMTILLCTSAPWKDRFRELFAKGIPIAVITLALSAWWFIRNAIIYNGDFLGRDTFNMVSEKYAKPHLRPSAIQNPYRQGWSLLDLIFYQNPGWPHNWFILSFVSFVGTFGHFDVYMEESVSKLYLYVLFAGFMCMLFFAGAFHLRSCQVTVTNQREAGRLIRTRTVVKDMTKFSREGVFNFSMFMCMVTAFCVYLYYVYFADIQAQGRYFMNAIYPIMYFVTVGFSAVLDKLRTPPVVKKCFCGLLSLAWIIGAVLNYFLIILPAYN